MELIMYPNKHIQIKYYGWLKMRDSSYEIQWMLNFANSFASNDSR